MKYRVLSTACEYRKDRISADEVNEHNYISTENMLPNRGGIETASSMADGKTFPAYKEGDILLSNIRPYFKKIWFADKKGGCSNDVLVLKTNQSVDKRFLYYVLSDNNFFNYSTVTSKGTKMPRGSKAAIMKYLVPDVNMPTQKRIAEILSAYDDLIENNNRRIALLEKAAQKLYKEWFVRFRFPGCETAEFEEKKPFGWSVSYCEKTQIPYGFDYCEFSELGGFTRGRNITAAEMVEGEIPVVSAGLQPSGHHNKANVIGRSLTVSASGANAGYLQYNLSDIWAADCSYYQNEKNLWFVYCTLKFLQPVISNLQCGAAQPHVYPKNINKLCVLKPTENLITKFNQTVEPFFDEIETLKNKNDNLIKQRDLLLSRLMSGKLEV